MPGQNKATFGGGSIIIHSGEPIGHKIRYAFITEDWRVTHAVYLVQFRLQ